MLHFAMVKGRFESARVRRAVRPEIQALMARYSAWADTTVKSLFPRYHAVLDRNRVTYRPNERSSTQPLHVDSSYGFPTQGRAMFRLFCNINPQGRPRVWQVGERFEPFARNFAQSLRFESPGWSERLLSKLGAKLPTTRRSPNSGISGKKTKNTSARPRAGSSNFPRAPAGSGSPISSCTARSRGSTASIRRIFCPRPG